MLEKLLSLLLFAFFLSIFIPILRYTYFVWFRGNEFIQRMKDNRPRWHRQSSFLSTLIELPYQLLISRITISVVFLVSTPMLVVLLWLVVVTWLH